MLRKAVQKLDHGLYRVHWKQKDGGGTSLASVGSLHSGERWIAPTNWTAKDGDNPIGFEKIWKSVERMELIAKNLS